MLRVSNRKDKSEAGKPSTGQEDVSQGSYKDSMVSAQD